MSKPHKLSVMEGGGAPVESAEEEYYLYLPFHPDPNCPAECEEHIKRVFEAVVKHYGEDEARRIFSPYGRPRTKREKSLEENALLYLEYCVEGVKRKRKPNVRQLAVRLAKEKNTDPGAMERKIWRAIKSKKVHRYLSEH